MPSPSEVAVTRAQRFSKPSRPRSRRSDSSITCESRLPVRAALILTARKTSSSRVTVGRVFGINALYHQAEGSEEGRWGGHAEMTSLPLPPPPFELEEGKRKPHLERIKPLVQ